MEIRCPNCKSEFSVISTAVLSPTYCPFCQMPLIKLEEKPAIKSAIPDPSTVLFTVGPYQILRSIGQGGMGEVFLAYDPTCGRQIALKRIRPDLLGHEQLQRRFLREARITSQLTHPAIIPIYAIQATDGLLYYTMPFVEGQTLKQILTDAKEHEKVGHKPDLFTAIPSLVRIFLNVCQAVAYAHSQGIIHRDLKPHNVIVGRYGEVLILDWGLAKVLHDKEKEFVGKAPRRKKRLATDETRIGKIVGTVSYMAPERALGNPANLSTDVYALGVILYQILTLHHPFHRVNLKEFRQRIGKEVIVEPAEMAPYREVPPILSRITLKCLAFNPSERYQSVTELIHDLEGYLEGRSEWFKVAELEIHRKSDWEFQENVLLAEHMAITRGTETSGWVSLMVSKASFSGNVKIKASVRIGEHGNGLGFLIDIPKASERAHMSNGYCLWVGSDQSKSTKLLRSNVEVMYAPESFFQRNAWHQISIEKVENNVSFYLNDQLQFSYIGHLPLSGNQLGLLARDADFEIKDFQVFVGSQNIRVNCLAVPDAFLAHKNFEVALSEYRKIGEAFPGTAESREALFRAGITLLEEVNSLSKHDQKQEKIDAALEEFSKLHKTSGAPLEYLGKALVYQNIGDDIEEAKCFELAFRRYPKHPLLPVLLEQLVHRLHETSRNKRTAAYHLALLAIRYLPDALTGSLTKGLFNNLKKHWEPLSFIEEHAVSEQTEKATIAIKLAFWLAKPYVIEEIIEENLKEAEPDINNLFNAIFSFKYLGLNALAKKYVEEITAVERLETEVKNQFSFFLEEDLPQAIHKLHTIPTALSHKFIQMWLEEATMRRQIDLMCQIVEQVNAEYLSVNQLMMDCYFLWALLWQKKWNDAGQIFQRYSLEKLTHDSSPLHFLCGCWLYIVEGPEIAKIHFSSVLEVAFPRTWSLFSHFVYHPPQVQERWLAQAFLWEKRNLYRQLSLFHHCKGDEDKANEYWKLELNDNFDEK